MHCLSAIWVFENMHCINNCITRRLEFKITRLYPNSPPPKFESIITKILIHQLQLIFIVICAQQKAFRPAYLDGLKLCNHFNHQPEATHIGALEQCPPIHQHSLLRLERSYLKAPKTYECFRFESRICKHISNAGYGTARFFITVIGPLQKHFQCRLWRCKFPHHGDRTIAKTSSMTTFMFITYGATSSQTT
jgi:hypothetical protein